MSFKVKDLTVVVSGALGTNEASTCTGWTRPECLSSIFWQDGRLQHDLAALKTQLRNAMTRA